LAKEAFQRTSDDMNGTVGDVTVLRSLDTRFGLDPQAVSAAKQWLFNPGMKDGMPVAVRVTIEMSFTLA
jgi:TonB family protein